MRASRLVQLLLLLQARGRITAAVLAEELEVSERTIHRDVDALSAAGVPIYAERGPHGGIQLVDGYRTRLTGLTGDEAEALFLSGLPGPAAELGLGTVVAAARLKVLASLPTELRARASRLVERFHLDAAGWFHASESVPHLATLADAVWEARRLRIRYRRGDPAVERVVEPLGLVLKAGIWYVVATIDGQSGRIGHAASVDATPPARPSSRPAGFDLAKHWTESIAAYERDTPRVTVTLRVDPGRSASLPTSSASGAAPRRRSRGPTRTAGIRLRDRRRLARGGPRSARSPSAARSRSSTRQRSASARSSWRRARSTRHAIVVRMTYAAERST